jgi:tRNA threonylcarbamoyl adenosine modification protein YeaZ
MTYCLAIETSSTHLGVSLYAFSLRHQTFEKRQTVFAPSHRRQAELLIPTIDRLLREEKISKKKLALIAVDRGPGSFTGVRVGVSAARAIAQGLDLPLIGVNSLEALTYEESKKNKFSPQTMVAVLPAQVNEMYGAIYKVGRHSRVPFQQSELLTGRTVDNKSSKRYESGNPGDVVGVIPACRKRGSKLIWVLDSRLRHSGMTTLAFAGVTVLEVVPPVWSSISDFTLKLKKLHLPLPTLSLRSPHPNALAEIAILRFFGKPKSSSFHYSKMKPFYLQPSYAERARLDSKR